MSSTGLERRAEAVSKTNGPTSFIGVAGPPSLSRPAVSANCVVDVGVVDLAMIESGSVLLTGALVDVMIGRARDVAVDDCVASASASDAEPDDSVSGLGDGDESLASAEFIIAEMSSSSALASVVVVVAPVPS